MDFIPPFQAVRLTSVKETYVTDALARGVCKTATETAAALIVAALNAAHDKSPKPCPTCRDQGIYRRMRTNDLYACGDCEAGRQAQAKITQVDRFQAEPSIASVN